MKNNNKDFFKEITDEILDQLISEIKRKPDNFHKDLIRFSFGEFYLCKTAFFSDAGIEPPPPIKYWEQYKKYISDLSASVYHDEEFNFTDSIIHRFLARWRGSLFYKFILIQIKLFVKVYKFINHICRKWR